MKTADVIDYLVEDEATRVICLFLEEIGDPARFARAAARADRAGKPIVALKVGSSPAGQQAALAHTGSVAGDDAVVDAVLRQLNVIRVTSLEELLTTGALLGYNRWPRRAADGRAHRVRRGLRHHRRRGQRAGHRDPRLLAADGGGDRRAAAAVRQPRTTRWT